MEFALLGCDGNNASIILTRTVAVVEIKLVFELKNDSRIEMYMFESPSKTASWSIMEEEFLAVCAIYVHKIILFQICAVGQRSFIVRQTI